MWWASEPSNDRQSAATAYTLLARTKEVCVMNRLRYAVSTATVALGLVLAPSAFAGGERQDPFYVHVAGDHVPKYDHKGNFVGYWPKDGYCSQFYEDFNPSAGCAGPYVPDDLEPR
jgi:hypothetical protein